MLWKALKAILVMAVIITSNNAVLAADNSVIIGDWIGVLSVSGMEVRIIFHITGGENGSLGATMDSPDQGATGIPTSGVSFDGDSLVVDVAISQAAYYAKYYPDSLFIDGEWRQAGFVLPLRLERLEEYSPPARPQEPERPLPYIEEEVGFENPGAGIRLAGTLTIPEGDGPFPAVVLISGSGPQDRDETVMGHRPFLVLSDHLTRSGIAVLRFDDRGVGGSEGDHGSATTADFATDARSAFEYLEAREETDPVMTGLAGHSEGGMIVSMVAAEFDDVDFGILLAGPGVPGSQILLTQNIKLLKLQGASDEVCEKLAGQLKEEYGCLGKDGSDEEVREAIIAVSVPMLDAYSPEEKETYGFTEAVVRQRADIMTTPWFRFFITYDPAPDISRIKCPVLAIIGEKDIQVDAGENLPAIEKALQDGGNRNYVVKEMPGLNHLFQTADTGNVSEYATIEETMSPAVLEMVSGWIMSLQTGGK
jgi:pimeloyl-ACP methyl ester carboxylesterase